jgi:hypothetical protein
MQIFAVSFLSTGVTFSRLNTAPYMRIKFSVTAFAITDSACNFEVRKEKGKSRRAFQKSRPVNFKSRPAF